MPQSSADSRGVYREQISCNHNLVVYEIESFFEISEELRVASVYSFQYNVHQSMVG